MIEFVLLQSCKLPCHRLFQSFMNCRNQECKWKFIWHFITDIYIWTSGLISRSCFELFKESCNSDFSDCLRKINSLFWWLDKIFLLTLQDCWAGSGVWIVGRQPLLVATHNDFSESPWAKWPTFFLLEISKMFI